MAGGRPRQFDPEVALDRAMEVFWRNGYEGTTLPELTKAMGINRPSMYATFGNKEALFGKVVQRYLEGPASHLNEALAQPTVREVVQAFFSTPPTCRDPENRPKGCLIVQGALSCGEASQSIQKLLTEQRQSFQKLLRERFDRGVAEGDLPATANPDTLAKLVCALNFGLAVLSADGATTEELAEVKNRFLSSWDAACRGDSEGVTNRAGSDA